MSTSRITPFSQHGIAGGAAEKYLPEPASRGIGLFKDVLHTTTRVAGQIAESAVGGSFGIQPEFSDLIAQQIELQKQMQYTTMLSNNERSKHETKMAAIRNMRVG